MAIDDLLVKLANLFPKQKLQTVFLINNYYMTIAVLKAEAVLDGAKIRMQFEELPKDNTAIFVVVIQIIALNVYLFQEVILISN
ncbi:vacuolar protein sorting-associated protein 52 B-like [Olea europaea var. sylvestris]|uniref:vacuolar protein sorting-associated protein 52 B-like n=1 Tax=Olea europaea var. sylvestris TaxID=158386 RepID=UPI000C1D5D6B|nr:vacuolar protein sorting-associated protein 52 B-like [Olea europaea var. sylvestris]